MIQNWNIQETNNYIFYYPKGSVAEKEINKIIKLQENCHILKCGIFFLT